MSTVGAYEPKKCIEPLHNCPKCKRHFPSGERYWECPDCGTDLHCGHFAVPGWDRCSNHGGPAPSRGFYGVGRAIVTGEDSRFPLTKAAAKYVKMREDGRWLSNRAAIEVVRGRIMQLLERIDANEAPDRLANLYRIWTDFRGAEKHGDSIEAVKLKAQLEDEFEAVYHDYAAWKQLLEVVDLDRKLTESEVKIVKDLKAMLTAEDAHEFAAKLLAAIIDAINGAPDISNDARVYLLKRINYEFGRITGYGDGQPSTAGAERGDPEIIDA